MCVCVCEWVFVCVRVRACAQYSDCNPIFRTLILTLHLVPYQNKLNTEQSEYWQMFYYISWAIPILYTCLWLIIQLLQISKLKSTIWITRKNVAFPYTKVSFWRYLLTHNVQRPDPNMMLDLYLTNNAGVMPFLSILVISVLLS